MGLELIA